MLNNGFLSKRVKLKNQSGITSDRYQFLGLDQAEPNLGDPIIGVSSIGAKPYNGNISDLYVLVTDNTGTGNRYWKTQSDIISTGVLTPGSITVRANGSILGGVNQITDLDFVGTGITVKNPASWVGAGSSSVEIELKVGISSAAGNYKYIQYNGNAGVLDGSDNFIFDPTTQRVGINSSLPKETLDVVGNGSFSGIVTSSSYGVSNVANISTNLVAISTTTSTSIESFSSSIYRSAKIQVQISQGTDYQSSDLLLVHNGTISNIVEYGSVSTNDYLCTFSSDISGGNARLLVNMTSSSSATVKVISQKITVWSFKKWHTTPLFLVFFCYNTIEIT